MRVDFTTFGVEPPDSGKPGQARPSGTPAAGAAGNASDNPSVGTSSAAPGVDQARFSFDQTRVRALQAQVLAQPEVRDAKVQALQQEIGHGEYSVSAGQVADALIQDVNGTQDFHGTQG